MRRALFYNPRLLCERLATESHRRRRLSRLHGTAAAGLSLGHIDSLELLELLRARDIRVIYDVGANVGTWTLLAKSVFPAAEIHAFEPLPRHCDGFAANVDGLERLELHRIALGSMSDDSRSLRVTSFSDASSLLPLAARGQAEFGVNEVECLPVTLRRLDDYRTERDLPLPDLIKLDVQGFELEVLRGAELALRSAKALIAELSFAEFYEGQSLFEEFVGFVAARGFRLTALGVNTPLGQPLAQTDGLFLRAA
jgi:FkbM family methyltransferase